MKKLLIVSMMALAIVACNKSRPTATDAASADDGAPSKENRSGNAEADGGNAGDETQPNTMAFAASEGRASTYAGKIGGKIEATLMLHRLGSVARGTMTYKSSGKPIAVLGKVEEDGTFFLREYLPDGLVTGVMMGHMKGDKLSGTWNGTAKENDLQMEMTRTQMESDEDWPYFPLTASTAGEYGYHYPAMAGNAGAAGGIILKHKDERWTFSIDCVTGPPGYRTASIEETEAEVVGDMEIHHTLADGDCQFVIRFFDGFAVVEHVGEHYDCGFGMGAGIEGEYLKLR